MHRRRPALVAALAAAALTLAGCGLGSDDSGSAGAKPTVDANAQVTGEVSFQTWALKPKFTSYVEGVIKAFETKYPGTKVTWLDQPGDGYDKKVLSQAPRGRRRRPEEVAGLAVEYSADGFQASDDCQRMANLFVTNMFAMVKA